MTGQLVEAPFLTHGPTAPPTTMKLSAKLPHGVSGLAENTIKSERKISLTFAGKVFDWCELLALQVTGDLANGWSHFGIVTLDVTF